ncbi:hypothetical protein LCGC14_0691780 [marine sediment metagenome]|uniref:Uncharacterized protein n=1 Tax=marine sediment metagenome TaxID=412755 RepID=A0A0F9QQ46_9ZZZZ
MPRTSETAVKAVISTSLTTTQVEQFIGDASLWVDEELTSSGLSAGRLELIERYLTCALIRLRDLGLTQAKFDDITEHYQVDKEVTDYLLRAAAMDPTGTVRRYFMAPADVRPVQYRVATRFVDDTATSPADDV